jgi:hypothetical protein
MAAARGQRQVTRFLGYRPARTSRLLVLVNQSGRRAGTDGGPDLYATDLSVARGARELLRDQDRMRCRAAGRPLQTGLPPPRNWKIGEAGLAFQESSHRPVLCLFPGVVLAPGAVDPDGSHLGVDARHVHRPVHPAGPESGPAGRRHAATRLGAAPTRPAREAGAASAAQPDQRRFAMYRAFWRLRRGLGSIPVPTFTGSQGDYS